MQIRLPRVLGTFIARRLTARAIQPGAVIHPPAALNVSGRTLLYFKSEGCAPCDGIDLFIGRLASASGLSLRVVDARRGALPEHGYGDGLLLDKTGELRRAYRVNVFPTLILTDEHGRVERVIVGGEADEGAIRAGLGLT